MASRVNGAERRAIAQYITGKTLSGRDQVNTPTSADRCSARGDFATPLTGNNWNGWGNNTNNTRFQPAPAASLTAAQLPRLKVKWAFGFPGDLDANAQPSVVGGRVFVGSQGGIVYSLSAERAAASTGFTRPRAPCVGPSPWRLSQQPRVRHTRRSSGT